MGISKRGISIGFPLFGAFFCAAQEPSQVAAHFCAPAKTAGKEICAGMFELRSFLRHASNCASAFSAQESKLKQSLRMKTRSDFFFAALVPT